MGIVNARNWKKFLKAIRTENPIEVFINISKKLIRTFFKTYKNKMISFQESKPAVLWVLPNTPAKDQSSGDRRLHQLFELLTSFLDLYIFTEGERKNPLPEGVTLIPEISPQSLKKKHSKFSIYRLFLVYHLRRYPHPKGPLPE